jgi:hypothetical protein
MDQVLNSISDIILTFNYLFVAKIKYETWTKNIMCNTNTTTDYSQMASKKLKYYNNT